MAHHLSSPSIIKKEHEQFPNEWFWQQRAYPFEDINFTAYTTALQQAKTIASASKRTIGEWELAGPINIGGRINDVEMHPSSTDIMYVGAASGGIFKSTLGEKIGFRFLILR